MGASGMVGGERVTELRKKYGNKNAIASDIREESPVFKDTGPYVILDALDAVATRSLVKKEKITSIYMLAGLISAGGEKNPELCWKLNMGSLQQVLDLAK